MKTYRSSRYSQKYGYYKKPFRKTKGFYILLILIIAIIGFIYWSITKTPENETDNQKYTDQEFSPDMAAKLISIEGTVETKTDDSTWQAINENYEINIDTYVRTAENSKAIIELPDKSLIRMSENAQIKFVTLGMSDIIIEQISGNVFHRINDASTAIYRVKNGNTEFTALGTGFNILVSSNLNILTVTASRVKIKIYDNNNITNMRTIEAGTKAIVNPDLDENNSIKTEDVNASDLLTDDWYAWNLEQDTAQDFYVGIFSEITKLIITEPKSDNLEINDNKITLKGVTDPEAEIFVSGKELENNNGEFESEILLSSGENEITITVKKDKSINKKTIIVNSTKQAEEINLTGQVKNTNQAELTWSVKNIENIKEYKIVGSTEINPTYPNDTYHTMADDKFTDNWDNISEPNYNFRVCALSSENKCIVYSNNLTLNFAENEEKVEETKSTILLNINKNNNEVSLTWNSTNLDDFDNFKSIISTEPNPSYPINSNHTLAKTQRNDTWKGLNAGTYNFRICALKDNECILYSNNASVQITNDDLGSLQLSGYSENGKTYLSWTNNNVPIEKGYKIMMSSQSNIIFPGEMSHLATSETDTSDLWDDLNIGQTYYFKICQNLSNTCGISSNEISITIK